MYKSLTEFFESAKGIKYVVLRNYEKLADEKLLAEHQDIDILCEDVNEAACKLDLIKIAKSDLTHYFASVGGNKVRIDLRHVGDGYYCKKWEESMLLDSEEFKGIRVLSVENYYYSLIYHVLVHKMVVSADYIERLNAMSQHLSVPHISVGEYESILRNYMSDKGYCFSLPNYTGTIVNLKNIDMRQSDFTYVDYFLRKVKYFFGIKY